MKKLILVLITFCYCLISNAQIQTKFFGLELSKTYSSLGVAKSILSQRCEHIDIDKDEISAYNIQFGGHQWEGVRFEFFKTPTGYILYRVFFCNPDTEPAIAKVTHISLLNSLNKKYGKPIDKSDELQQIWILPPKTNICCSLLCVNYSYGNRECWGLTLQYTDLIWLEEEKSENDAEL
jgi:hypothetical protein